MVINMRDEFSQNVKELLSKRVLSRCSSSKCRKSTSCPPKDPSIALDVDVADHIAANSPDGPIYGGELSSEKIKSIYQRFLDTIPNAIFHIR